MMMKTGVRNSSWTMNRWLTNMQTVVMFKAHGPLAYMIMTPGGFTIGSLERCLDLLTIQLRKGYRHGTFVH